MERRKASRWSVTGSILPAVLVLSFAASPRVRAEDPAFTLEFISAAPEEFTGISRAPFGPFEVSAALRSAGLEELDGPWGWSFGAIHHPLLELIQVTLDGTNAGDLLDEGTGFLHLEMVDPGENEGLAGYVLATVLSQEPRSTLPPNRLSTIASATFRGAHPWVAVPTETLLDFQFVDGLRGSRGEVSRRVSCSQGEFTPASEPFFRLLRTTPSCNVGLGLEVDAPGSRLEENGRVLRLEHPAGQELVVEASVRISLSLGGGEGPEGWSLSVKHDRPFFELLRATTDGADFLRHADPELRFLKTEVIDDEDGAGFISAVVLSLSPEGPRTLPRNGALTLARARYRLVAPHDAPGVLPPTSIRFEDGLKGGENSPPVNNIFTVDGKTQKACNRSALTVEVAVVRGGKVYARADATNDARINLADAVRMAQNLFFGGGAVVCPAAVDSNGDLRFDGSDPIHLLSYLFQSGGRPPPPFPTCGPDPHLENPLPCEETAVRCP